MDIDFIKKISESKKSSKLIVIIGIIGMILIMISSFIPEKQSEDIKTEDYRSDYLSETEKRLGDFLKNVEGVGNVKVMITLEGEELYIYAQEGKKTISENKTEEENSYVMSGREKTPIIETINNPQIKGVVIACEGASSPAVKEAVYYVVSKALGISSGNIYVTKLS